jgi:hypothetical protein
LPGGAQQLAEAICWVTFDVCSTVASTSHSTRQCRPQGREGQVTLGMGCVALLYVRCMCRQAHATLRAGMSSLCLTAAGMP